MKIFRILATTAMALSITTGGLFSLPSAALANTGSDAAVGAAVGSIIGQLLFDSHRQQYYYVQSRRRHYVDRGTAQRYHERMSHNRPAHDDQHDRGHDHR